MIKATVGRVVHFHPYMTNVHAAIVTYVHNDTGVNLAVFDHKGNHYARTSVGLVQGDTPPAELLVGRATWMPYQIGQAAKTEDLEAKLGAARRTPTPTGPS